MAQIQIRDTQDRPLAHINIRIATGTLSSDAAIFDYDTDLAGNKGWPIPYWPIRDYTLYINYSDVNPAYDQQTVYVTAGEYYNDIRVVLNNTVAPPVPVPPPGPAPILDPIRVDGLRMVRSDGSTFVYKGFTDFLLYQKYLAGDNLDAILHERIAVGANTLRVLGMVTSFSHFHPQEHGDYYDRLKPFADYVGSFGLRVEFVVFADAQIIMPQFADETAHIDRVVAALHDVSNVFIEVCNEPFKNIPGGADTATVLARHIQGRGLLVASGNYDFPAPGDPTPPSADYITFHPERKPEWPRTSKDAFDFREVYHKPVISDEPMGCAEIASESRSNVPADFAYFAATAALEGAGSTFHAEDGIYSRLLGPIQRECAVAFFSAMDWVPVDAQLAPYQRGEEFGGPGIGNMPMDHTDVLALRTFCKQVAGVEYCVAIRPAVNWTATARDGWRILDQSGPRGALIRLVK